MKRILIVCIFALTATSCKRIFGWELGEVTHDAFWYVKNTTAGPLLVESVGFLETQQWIEPGDSSCLFRFCPETVGFETFYTLRSTAPDDNWHIDLLSAEGLLHRRWRFADREADGKRFFGESSWRFYSEKTSGSESLKLTWVFDVGDEDLTDEDE